jgi:hypothetical protein
MPTINTLPAISLSLGLHRNTLSVLFGRADKRGEARPQPFSHYGANGGVAIYDVDEVSAWYVARSFDPKPKRGADKQPRKRQTA